MMFRPICFTLIWAAACSAFMPQQHFSRQNVHLFDRRTVDDDILDEEALPRRQVLSGLGKAMTVFLVGGSSTISRAEEEVEGESSFAAIAARASQISKEIDKENAQVAANVRKSEKTAYDFELPVEGNPVKFADIIKQEFYDDGVKVKAILVVNIKQDDPVARKTIPELISLATKYARNRDGALAIVCCPTCV